MRLKCAIFLNPESSCATGARTFELIDSSANFPKLRVIPKKQTAILIFKDGRLPLWGVSDGRFQPIRFLEGPFGEGVALLLGKAGGFVDFRIARQGHVTVADT